MKDQPSKVPEWRRVPFEQERQFCREIDDVLPPVISDTMLTDDEGFPYFEAAGRYYMIIVCLHCGARHSDTQSARHCKVCTHHQLWGNDGNLSSMPPASILAQFRKDNGFGAEPGPLW